MGSVPSLYEDQAARPRPSRHKLRKIYRQYADEGHLVMIGFVEGDHAGESWVGWCVNCGASSFDKSDVQLLTFEDLAWWARSHRTEHDLPWQDWAHAVDIRNDEWVGGLDRRS